MLRDRRNRRPVGRRPSAMREGAKKSLNSYTVMRENYKAYKKAQTGSDVLTAREIKAMREAIKEANANGEVLKECILNDVNTAIANLKKYKEAKTGESRLTYKEVKSLREAVDAANKKGIKLNEADAGFADPNAGAMGADPNAAGRACSPDVQSQIQQLLSQVQALATAAGVQVNDLGGNPQADVPPVDGQAPAADAAQPQPMMEAIEKYRKEHGKITEEAMIDIKKSLNEKLTESEKLSDRIAMRQAKLDMLNEGFEGDFADAYLSHLTEKGAGKAGNTANPINSIPSPDALARGYADGPAAKEMKPAKTWPTKEYNDAPLQGSGTKQKKMKESEEGCQNCGENTDEDKKLEESAVTDKYLDNYFNKKLDFSALKEAMQKGILG